MPLTQERQSWVFAWVPNLSQKNAMGAKVYRNPLKEIGWFPEPRTMIKEKVIVLVNSSSPGN